MALKLKHEQNRKRAAEQIKTVRQMAETGQIGIVTWYRELTASEMYELRIAARAVNLKVKVVRNRLAHRALEGTAFACLQTVLEGPVLLAFSEQGPAVAARLLRDFAKEHDKLVIKYLSIDGELFTAVELDRISNLPTKEEAIAHLSSALQSPIRQLLGLLGEPQQRLLRTLKAIKKT